MQMDVWTSVHGVIPAWRRVAWATCSPALSPPCWRKGVSRGKRRAWPWACMRVPATSRPARASAACWRVISSILCAPWATHCLTRFPFMPDSQQNASWDLPDEAATVALATRVAEAMHEGAVVYLHGPLGAGKTSFARALLAALGVGERIKSPTYSLIEGYQAQAMPAWHLDLYRIADPGEL